MMKERVYSLSMAAALAASVSLFAAAPAQAESHGMQQGMSHDMGQGMQQGMSHDMGQGMSHGMGHGMAQGPVAATGEVRSINAAKGKIKLKHDPIPSLGWPVMVMDFGVKDAKLLKGLKPGDRVKFTMEASSGAYVVSAISKADK